MRVGRRELERRLVEAAREAVRSTNRLKLLSRWNTLHKAGRDQARGDLAAVRDERDKALYALTRIAMLHHRLPSDSPGAGVCVCCCDRWPCPTIVLADRVLISVGQWHR